jgi:hypothetical protein
MNDEANMSRRQAKTHKDFLQTAKSALENDDTRVLVRWILDQAGVYDTSSSDAGTRRDLGLEIIAMLHAIDPYEYVRLMKEAADDVVRKRNEARRTDNVSSE